MYSFQIQMGGSFLSNYSQIHVLVLLLRGLVVPLGVDFLILKHLYPITTLLTRLSMLVSTIIKKKKSMESLGLNPREGKVWCGYST